MEEESEYLLTFVRYVVAILLPPDTAFGVSTRIDGKNVVVRVLVAPEFQDRLTGQDGRTYGALRSLLIVAGKKRNLKVDLVIDFS